jgi:hypothetical protein
MWVVRPGSPGHALTLTSAADMTKVGVLSAPTRYYHPAGLPLRSGPFHLRLIEPVFADEAAQTGLSCSDSDLECVPLPIPRRDPTGRWPDETLPNMAFAVT